MLETLQDNALDKEDELSDKELIQQVQSGSDEAFRVLVSRYKNYVFTIIGRQVQDRDVAEELSQDVFVRSYKAMSRYRGECSFKTWITRISLNTSYSYFRSKKFSKQKVTVSTEEETFQEHGVSDHDPIFRKEIMVIFKNCFGKMKIQMQQVVTLCGYEEQSYEEAAEVLEVPVGTIRSRLNRARLTLKECMERQGVSL